MEAVIACVAIKKAVKAEKKAGSQELRASILEEENTKLKSKLKGKES